MAARHADQSAREKLARVQAPWVSGTLGLAIIFVAFGVSLVNALLKTPNTFLSMTLQPLIFVGMGLLLYHIGLHVHAVHQNVILMVTNTDDQTRDDPSRASHP